MTHCKSIHNDFVKYSRSQYNPPPIRYVQLRKHKQSLNHISLKTRPRNMLCTVTHCAGCVSANARPRVTDWEMGTASACTECSQAACIDTKVPSLCTAVLGRLLLRMIITMRIVTIQNLGYCT